MKILAEMEVNTKVLTQVEDGSIDNALAWCAQSGLYVKQHMEIPDNANINHLFQLTETVEGTDGIRDFYILATAWDINLVKEQMREKIEQDAYGLIAKNGVRTDDELIFETEYEHGFVKYEIISTIVTNKI